MAMVPDEAIDEMGKVSKSAFTIFVYLCRRRNRKTGLCFPSLKRIARDCNLNYSYASCARRELVEAGWIEIYSDGNCRVIKGFGKSQEAEYWEALENPNTSLENPNTPLENPNSEFGKSKSLYKGINQRIEPEKVTSSVTNARPRETATEGDRLSADFSPSDSLTDWARVRHPEVDVLVETEKFVNYYTSLGGSAAVRVDWGAVWKNWIINSKREYAKQGSMGNTKKAGLSEKLRDIEDMLGTYR